MKTGKKNILSTTAFISVFTALIWEIGEEILENLIAQTLANFLVMFITKLLSVLTVIILTKGAKKIMSKTLMPFIKKFIYKEGLDKMQTLKRFFTKLFTAIKGGVKFVCVSNPRTSLATLTSVLLSYGFGLTIDTTNLLSTINFPDVTLFGIEIVPYIISVIAFVIMYFNGIKFGVETNSEADERKLTEKAEKENKRAEKEKAEQEAKAKAEKEAFEQEAQKLAEEMIKKAEQEKAEREAREKAEKEKAEQEAIEKEKQNKLEQRAREILEARKKELEEKDNSTETDINIIL